MIAPKLWPVPQLRYFTGYKREALSVPGAAIIFTPLSALRHVFMPQMAFGAPLADKFLFTLF
ncbi:MAG: hypothetical protein DU429_08565 [Candidatus Tokpelaia sp.]|nr:MAG: hypothetical protein DU429_08565 [Candidatus Tokpelaia sp.]KAA6206016.1 MAG: hypothetical protein DU430_02490 [Candidatus Tokpelaia sp.]